MALEPKDVVIHLTQGVDGAYFQFRHQPTGVETEPLPRELFHASKQRLMEELEQKVADKLAGKTGFEGFVFKPEELEVEVINRGQANVVRLRHLPTGTQLGPIPSNEFKQNKKQYLLQLNAVVSDLTMIEPRGRYFPLELYANFTPAHYRKHLWTMHETSIWQASNDVNLHAYRFLWLPTFDNPLVVRLELHHEQPILTAKITNGQGGYEPGRIVNRVEKTVSYEHVSAFMGQLEGLEFWQKNSSGDDWGIDGSIWLLEALRKGRYKFMQSWSPRPDDPFRVALWSLVEMAGLEVEQVY